MTQKNSIEIYVAGISDIPEMAELERLCFAVPWSEKALFETMSQEQSVFLVAKISDNVCGYIGSYYVLDEGYITNVAVNPECRRNGVGRTLVSELIKRGKELSLSFWTLEVRSSNVPAIALYEKMGFENVGRRPRFYSNPCEDAELMTYYFGKERDS